MHADDIRVDFLNDLGYNWKLLWLTIYCKKCIFYLNLLALGRSLWCQGLEPSLIGKVCLFYAKLGKKWAITCNSLGPPFAGSFLIYNLRMFLWCCINRLIRSTATNMIYVLNIQTRVANVVLTLLRCQIKIWTGK